VSCNDELYQRWWPGTHLSFHTITKSPNNVGNVVFMDEFVGDRRVATKATVREIVDGRRIVWQMKVSLPVFLILELEDVDDGVRLKHTIKAGFSGIGRIFDPILRIYFTQAFAEAMDEHVRTEFPKLRDMLRNRAAADSSLSTIGLSSVLSDKDHDSNFINSTQRFFVRIPCRFHWRFRSFWPLDRVHPILM
jgi:hypothetical protein